MSRMGRVARFVLPAVLVLALAVTGPAASAHHKPGHGHGPTTTTGAAATTTTAAPATTTTETTGPATTTTETTVPTTFQPAPTTTVQLPPADLLARTDLIYGAEIGSWRTDAKPAVDTATVIPQKVIDARIPMVRFAVYDTFTDLLNPLGNPGTLSRATFRNAITGITQTLHAVPWLKMLPLAVDSINGVGPGDMWCPPWTGDASGNLATYKAMLDEVRAVYSGPVILESNNEMEFSCWLKWQGQGAAITGAGSVGVSKRIGEHYAATMPALKAYARDVLGFPQVVTVGYIGVSGGPGWGQSYVADASIPYGYTFTYQDRWVDEFSTAVHDAYVANGSNPDYVPDVLSIHAYPHGGDFTATAGYELTGLHDYDAARPDDIIYAFYRGWLTRARSRVSTIWGATIGNQTRFAISEWSAGYSRAGDNWSGWTTAGRPDAFYTGWYQMLRGNGVTTGTGTRYWASCAFELSSNSDTGSGQYYNLTRMDGTTPSWWASLVAASTGNG